MSETSHFKPKTDSLPMTQITQAVAVLICFFYINSLSILISLMAQNFSGSIILTIFAVPAKIDSHLTVKDEDKRSNQPTAKQLRCHGTKKLITIHWFIRCLLHAFLINVIRKITSRCCNCCCKCTRSKSWKCQKLSPCTPKQSLQIAKLRIPQNTHIQENRQFRKIIKNKKNSRLTRLFIFCQLPL